MKQALKEWTCFEKELAIVPLWLTVMKKLVCWLFYDTELRFVIVGPEIKSDCMGIVVVRSDRLIDFDSEKSVVLTSGYPK